MEKKINLADRNIFHEIDEEEMEDDRAFEDLEREEEEEDVLFDYEMDTIDEDDEYFFFSLTRFTKEESGLPYDVYIGSPSRNGKSKITGRFPVIKIMLGSRLIPVICRKNGIIPTSPIPRRSMLQQWIVKNYEPILKHHYGIISDRAMLNALAHL